MTVFLESLKRSHPADQIFVLHEDILEDDLAVIKKYYREVKFISVKRSLNYTKPQELIPAKLTFYAQYLKKFEENEIVCIIDVDTLVYKNISELIKKDFDLIYTWKNERIYLNTGVLIVRNSERVRKFFEYWNNKTRDIIDNDQRLAEAIERMGAADQQSLADLLSDLDYLKGGKIRYEFGELKFLGYDCKWLNQTNSVPVSSGSYIFHYKAGWKSILLEEGEYTSKRPKSTSIQMKELWEDLFNDANENMAKRFVLDACEQHGQSFKYEDLDYREKGIINSEMLAVLAVTKQMNIELIIESGRYSGQSTKVLAEFYKGTDVRIISIEHNRGEIAKQAEKDLAGYKNLELLYGDSNVVVPRLFKTNQARRTAVLIDGPKGEAALKLMLSTLSHPNVLVGFVHDLPKPYRRTTGIWRDLVSNYFDRVFFTDDFEYVDQYSFLDKNIWAEDGLEWGPYHKNYAKTGSYGPTLGIILPTSRDRFRAGFFNRSRLVIYLNTRFPRLMKKMSQGFNFHY